MAHFRSSACQLMRSNDKMSSENSWHRMKRWMIKSRNGWEIWHRMIKWHRLHGCNRMIQAEGTVREDRNEWQDDLLQVADIEKKTNRFGKRMESWRYSCGKRWKTYDSKWENKQIENLINSYRWNEEVGVENLWNLVIKWRHWWQKLMHSNDKRMQPAR